MQSSQLVKNLKYFYFFKGNLCLSLTEMHQKVEWLPVYHSQWVIHREQVELVVSYFEPNKLFQVFCTGFYTQTICSLLRNLSDLLRQIVVGAAIGSFFCQKIFQVLKFFPSLCTGFYTQAICSLLPNLSDLLRQIVVGAAIGSYFVRKFFKSQNLDIVCAPSAPIAFLWLIHKL